MTNQIFVKGYVARVADEYSDAIERVFDSPEQAIQMLIDETRNHGTLLLETVRRVPG